MSLLTSGRKENRENKHKVPAIETYSFYMYTACTIIKQVDFLRINFISVQR